MLPIQVMDEFSSNFIHRRVLSFVSRVPGPIGMAASVASSALGPGGGAHKVARARMMSASQAQVHIGHGHGFDAPGHAQWPANWVPHAQALSAGGGRPDQILRGAGVSAARAAELTTSMATGCPEGFEMVGGVCKEKGIIGAVHRLVPGGATGVATAGFQAVAGSFGMPAVQPVQDMVRKLVCPSGFVLGDDDLCYPKAVLRRDSRFRKHRPGPRPILTGGQRNAIRKAKSAIRTAKESISGLGVTVKKKC